MYVGIPITVSLPFLLFPNNDEKTMESLRLSAESARKANKNVRRLTDIPCGSPHTLSRVEISKKSFVKVQPPTGRGHGR